jgi:hypothetical protein
MAAPRVKPRKLGQRNFLDVEVDTPRPRFPRSCACCLKPPDPTRTIRIQNRDKTHTFSVPACARCVRHATLTTFVAFTVLGITIVGALAAVFWLGAGETNARVPLDLRIYAGLTTVWRFIRSPMLAGVAVIVIAVVFFVVYLVVAGAAWLVTRGKDCTEPGGGAEVKKVPTGFLFSFENLEFGRRFADANKDG